jgi:hypothetical protein
MRTELCVSALRSIILSPQYSVLVTQSSPLARRCFPRSAGVSGYLGLRLAIREVQDPQHGKVKQVGIAPKLSETPGSVRRLAPSLGEHTDEVLGGIGLAQAEINRLREKGAIR